MFEDFFYKLDEDLNPISCSIDEMMEWMIANGKQIEKTQVTDDIIVSTVFLGVDHAYFFNAPPILFETMVIGGRNDRFIQRSKTWSEAEDIHNMLVDRIRSGKEGW